jgi:hypothetical protein
MLKGNEYIKELEAGQRFHFLIVDKNKELVNKRIYKFTSYEEMDGVKKIRVEYKFGNEKIIHEMNRSTIVKLIK